MASCVTIPFGPACANIARARAGDLNRVNLTVTSGGAPFDLSGYTLAAQVRGKVTDTEFMDAVVTVTDAATGKVTIEFPGEDVRTWLGGKASRSGVWDLQIDNGTDDPTTIIEGTFSAEMDVTRA